MSMTQNKPVSGNVGGSASQSPGADGADLMAAALVFVGLGVIVANFMRDWLPNATWIGAIGLLLVLSGGALRTVQNWKRTRTPR